MSPLPRRRTGGSGRALEKELRVSHGAKAPSLSRPHSAPSGQGPGPWTLSGLDLNPAQMIPSCVTAGKPCLCFHLSELAHL